MSAESWPLYRKIKLIYECSGNHLTEAKRRRLMEGTIRADKREIVRLLRTQLPGYSFLVKDLERCYRNNRFIVCVSRGVEYFFRYEIVNIQCPYCGSEFDVREVRKWMW